MIFAIDLNRFKYLFKEDLEILRDKGIPSEDVYRLGNKIDILNIDIIGGKNNIGLDTEYIVSRTKVKLPIDTVSIKNDMIQAFKTDSKEDALKVEHILMNMDINDSTKILFEFKDTDPDNYYGWVNLLETKDLFRKIVNNIPKQTLSESFKTQI